jgi:hypothetical protein
MLVRAAPTNHQGGWLRHFGGFSREDGLLVPGQQVCRLLYGPLAPAAAGVEVVAALALHRSGSSRSDAEGA